ncbi:MAG: hypothetical protein ACXACC_07670 [Promethearchaeota archaeon]|jgi:hypothetical protein
MTELLKDELNLRLLQEICSGNGLDVNISKLSNNLISFNGNHPC